MFLLFFKNVTSESSILLSKTQENAENREKLGKSMINLGNVKIMEIMKVC